METRRSMSPKSKDGVYSSSSNHSVRIRLPERKKRKARTLLLIGCFQKNISDVFMAWMMQKRSEHIHTDQGKPGEGSLLLREISSHVNENKKNIDTLSIDDLYNNLSVFEQDIQKTSSSSQTSENVAFLSQAKASSSKHKPSHNQEIKLRSDLEEMDIHWQIAIKQPLSLRSSTRRQYKRWKQAGKQVEVRLQASEELKVKHMITFDEDSFNALKLSYDNCNQNLWSQEASALLPIS
ncbi:hypothetical protein Tco_1319802 [Tanacetum coccineum]